MRQRSSCFEILGYPGNRLDFLPLLKSSRLKKIIVLANRKKVPPADMKNAAVLDHLIEQAILCGEGEPCLAALLVPNTDEFIVIAAGLPLDPEDPHPRVTSGWNNSSLSIPSNN